MRTVNAATVHLAPLCVRRVAPELAPAVVLKRAAADKVRDDAQYQLSIHTGRNFFNIGRLIDSILWRKCSALHWSKPRHGCLYRDVHNLGLAKSLFYAKQDRRYSDPKACNG